MSVQARASFCFIPPESRSASRSRKGVIRTMSSSSSRRARPAAHAVDLGEEGDVLVHREVAVEGEALREVADARGERGAARGRVEPAGADRAARRGEQAEDHAEGRGLAGAVRADEAEHLAARTSKLTVGAATTEP